MTELIENTFFKGFQIDLCDNVIFFLLRWKVKACVFQYIKFITTVSAFDSAILSLSFYYHLCKNNPCHKQIIWRLFHSGQRRPESFLKMFLIFVLHLDHSWTQWMTILISQPAKHRGLGTSEGVWCYGHLYHLPVQSHMMWEWKGILAYTLKYSGAENFLFLLVKHCLLKESVNIYAAVWRRGFSLVI